MHTIFAWALLATSMPSQQAPPGDNKQMLTTQLAAPPGAVDSNPSPEFREVIRLIGAKDFDAARVKIKPILDRCQVEEQDPKARIVDVSDTEEFLDFSSAEIIKGKNVSWVRNDCAAAYKGQAFMDVEAGDAQSAFHYLDLAAKRAPYWVEVYTERGFLLMRTGHPDDAIAAYQQAIDLTNRFKSEAHVKPLALRGMGFALTEMGKLDDAQKAYEDSLKIEPGNQLAKNELQYIDGLRKKPQSLPRK